MLDEILGCVRDGIPVGLQKAIVASLDFLEELRIVLGIKRREPTQKDIDDHAKRPDVTLLIVASHVQHLRGDVSCRTPRGAESQRITDRWAGVCRDLHMHVHVVRTLSFVCRRSDYLACHMEFS